MNVEDLWGENPNNLAQLEKVVACLGTSASPRCGSWSYPNINARTIKGYTLKYPVPIPLANLRLATGGVWLANSAYSVYKITYVFQYILTGADGNVVGGNYGNGTVFGKNMVLNGVPNTSSTDSTYALITDADPYAIQVLTANTRVGKTTYTSDADRPHEGFFQIVLWYKNSYHVVRVQECGGTNTGT